MRELTMFLKLPIVGTDGGGAGSYPAKETVVERAAAASPVVSAVRSLFIGRFRVVVLYRDRESSLKIETRQVAKTFALTKRLH